VICRRCGVSNTAGDQFCGSCGAFLEWEGDPTDAAAPTSEPAIPAPAATPAPQTTPSEPLPPPTIVSAPSMPGIACPACATLNPTQKVFCQSCGTDLRDAARAVGGVTTPAGTRKTQVEKAAGLPFWLPIVVVIGLLAGVAFVVAGIVMRPTPVPPGATTIPSVTFTPTLPPSPGTSAGSLPPATESGQLTLTGAKASSIVGNRAKFKADRVIDGNLQTAWQEGAKDAKGQWIEVSFASSRIDYVVIYSGYQLNHDAYLGNARPENVLVSVDGGPPIAFLLVDSEQPQRLDIDDTPGATTVRIEIDSSFDAVQTSYPGSPFDDLSISEIRVFGAAGG
jgi:double zinc ribbon protein